MSHFLQLCLMVSLFLFAGCIAEDAATGRTIAEVVETNEVEQGVKKGETLSVEQKSWALVQAGATLIDVRTQVEYDQGHFENVTLIPHEGIVAGVQKLQLAKDTQIVLYCRSGGRAGRARSALIAAGYKNVTNAGGYSALLTAKPQ